MTGEMLHWSFEWLLACLIIQRRISTNNSNSLYVFVFLTVCSNNWRKMMMLREQCSRPTMYWSISVTLKKFQARNWVSVFRTVQNLCCMWFLYQSPHVSYYHTYVLQQWRQTLVACIANFLQGHCHILEWAILIAAVLYWLSFLPTERLIQAQLIFVPVVHQVLSLELYHSYGKDYHTFGTF